MPPEDETTSTENSESEMQETTTETETSETTETETSPTSLLGETETDEAEASAFAPHDVENFSELFPESLREHISEEHGKAFAELLNQHEIGVEGAQALTAMFDEQQQLWQQTADRQFNEQQTALQAAARADAEIGGANFEQNLAAAKTVVDAYGSKELLERLNVTGLGNDPVLLRFLVNVSKAIPGEAKQIGETKASGPTLTLAQRFMNQGKN